MLPTAAWGHDIEFITKGNLLKSLIHLFVNQISIQAAIRATVFATVISVVFALSPKEAFSAPAPATAGGHPFGIGIILGAPSALTAKHWIDQRSAIDGGLAFSLNEYFLFYSDYLHHFPGLFKSKDRFVSELAPYFGVGGLIAFTTSGRSRDDRYLGRSTGSLGLGVRIPLGIEWRPSDPHLGVFLELAPGLSVIPETLGLFQGGIGIRYYF